MAYNWQQDLPTLEQKYGIPAGLLGALVRAESGGQTNVRSPAGAIGLTQLRPATAKGLGVNPNDPRQNLEGGAKYLAQQLKAFGGNVPKALAAYNAGPGAVRQYGGVPPYKETQQYVKRLTSYWRESPRYGNDTSNNTSSPQRSTAQSTARRVNIPVPTAIPEPARRLTPGIENTDRLLQTAQYNPDYAQILGATVEGRQKKQAVLDQQYAKDFTSFQSRQAQIQAALQANQNSVLSPKTPKPGHVGRYIPGGPQNTAQYSSEAKFIRTPGGWVRNIQNGEQSYRFLQRVGRGFGLQNDPGNAQTTGGSHAAGSNHYSGRAVDFGDARNTRQQLLSFGDWARQNASNIRELYYTPLGFGIRNGQVIQGLTVPGHDDHLHAAW